MKVQRYVPAAARILLGLAFTVFGANFFLNFLPAPPHAGPAGDFLGALAASGFVMTVVKVTEVGAGLMLLTNRFVPLALTLLAPVLVGIVGFHLAYEPMTGVAGYVLLALELYLAWAYRDAFVPMLRMRVEPVGADAAQVKQRYARPAVA
jgi:putative oxidoreductase